MCVAFGGSLHQHVPDVTSGDVEHAQHKAGFNQHEPSHRVTLENLPNTVSELLGKDELMVNSFHHQSLGAVPAPLRIAGRADDGTIEAIWHPGMSFGIGVQWHPEMLALRYEDHAIFFAGLVEASRRPVAVD
jgi:putative glutamine amidotransferase